MKLHLLALVVMLALPANAALYGRLNPDTGIWMVMDSDIVPAPGKGWLPYKLTPPPEFNPARQKLVEVTPPPVVGGSFVQKWEKKRLTKAERDAIEAAKELAELAEDAKAVLVKLDDEKELTKEEVAIVLRFLLKMRGIP